MNKDPHYYGHRQRLKERFQLSESKGMPDYELLELLLTYSIPRKDVKPIAKKLLAQYKNLDDLIDAERSNLSKADGLGDNTITLIKLVKEICNKYYELQIHKHDILLYPDSVIKFAQSKLGGKGNEIFMVLFLNTKNELLNYEIITEGTIDNIIIYPRRIIEKALYNNAAGCILVHNHPSGYSIPSAEDKKITFQLKSFLKIIDVNLLDHIIVGKQNHFSFQEQGLLS